MRIARTKSTAKTFEKGSDIADLAVYVLDNIKTKLVNHNNIPHSMTQHKYVVTVTRIFERCDTCGVKFKGTPNGPICPKCEKNGQNNRDTDF